MSLAPQKYLFLILCFVSLGTATSLEAQKRQANHWYFGDHYGLHFSNGFAETDYSSSIYTYESCTTISNKEGKLLFYTNGGGRSNQAICGHIWNRNHEIMEGGDLGYEMGGGYSAAQGVVAFQKPGTADVYCMMTVDEFETISVSPTTFPEGKGCSYFEIDMAANNGLGAVTVQNQKLMQPAFEYMSATIHANCEDYWVIAPTGYWAIADDPNEADSFYVFQITENGPLNPQVFPMPEGKPNIADEYGFMKITPDGSRFRCGSHLYDFDNSTGTISYGMNLLDSIGLERTDHLGFSSNSRFLYQFRKTIQDTINKLIISQYDLEDSDFQESGELIGQTILSEHSIVGMPQLAPDGKLYFLLQEDFFNAPTRLAVIENPNVKGLGCQPNYNVLTISNFPDQRFLSFGNFPDNIFKYDPVITHDLGADITLNCEAVDSIDLFGPDAMDCYLWSNGAMTQNIRVVDAGVYWVEFWDDCTMGVDSMILTIRNELFEIDLGDDVTLCEQASLVLEGPLLADASYLWQDGSANMDLEITEAGSYWLQMQVADCIDRDTLLVTQDFLPVIDLGEDELICEGEEIRLNTNVDYSLSYEWQDGTTQSFLMASAPGTYGVTVTNDCGTATDEMELTVVSCKACKLYIPNAFSPNDDGYNDSYQTFSNCQMSYYDIQIFDRWGSQVYGSQNQEESWDGNLKGIPCLPAVYAFILHYEWQDQNGIPIREVVTGDIALLP